MLRLPRHIISRSRPFSSIHLPSPPPRPPPEKTTDNAPEQPTTAPTSDEDPTSSGRSVRPEVIVERLASVKALQEWTGPASAAFRNYADQFTMSAKARFSQLGSQLNKVTGYEEIEALKKKVVDQESRINETRNAARRAKIAHEQAASQRIKSQKEVNDLLQRKSTWSDGDVSRFTTLVRQDHLYEQEEHRAKVAVDDSEAAVEREFSELMRTILARYHEEQVWSDKIRSASTYGSLAALGLNLLVFIMAILIVEPWKRKRLAQTFEKKVEQLSQETATLVDDRIAKVESLLQAQTTLFNASLSTDTTPIPASESPSEPLGSEDIPQMRQHFLEAVVDAVVDKPEVQTALAASALAAGSIGWLLRTWFDR